MSYVNDDDKYANGKITKFREHLSRAVKAHGGKPFEIFQDKEDIKWGQQWQERINDSLDATLFLIPIITPSFFNSKPCRDEFERFLKREGKLGRRDLILPVYYFDCPVLNDKEKLKQDSLAEIIAVRQREDWRELRFKPLSAVPVRKALTKMAEQIVAALERGSINPSITDAMTHIQQTKMDCKELSVASADCNLAFRKDDRSPIDEKQWSDSPILRRRVDQATPKLFDLLPLFRDIVTRKFQAVPADDRPRPVPLATEELPPYALQGPMLRHVSGWHVRLRVGTAYQLRWNLALTEDWIENEFVLFQHVSVDPAGVYDHYERIASAGALASDQWSNHIIPTAESWLIGCYSKRYIGWDAPWYEMTPHKWVMNDDGRSLELLFARLPDSTSSEKDAHPTIWIEFSND